MGRRCTGLISKPHPPHTVSRASMAIPISRVRQKECGLKLAQVTKVCPDIPANLLHWASRMEHQDILDLDILTNPTGHRIMAPPINTNDDKVLKTLYSMDLCLPAP